MSICLFLRSFESVRHIDIEQRFPPSIGSTIVVKGMTLYFVGTGLFLIALTNNTETNILLGAPVIMCHIMLSGSLIYCVKEVARTVPERSAGDLTVLQYCYNIISVIATGTVSYDYTQSNADRSKCCVRSSYSLIIKSLLSVVIGAWVGLNRVWLLLAFSLDDSGGGGYDPVQRASSVYPVIACYLAANEINTILIYIKGCVMSLWPYSRRQMLVPPSKGVILSILVLIMSMSLRIIRNDEETYHTTPSYPSMKYYYRNYCYSPLCLIISELLLHHALEWCIAIWNPVYISSPSVGGEHQPPRRGSGVINDNNNNNMPVYLRYNKDSFGSVFDEPVLQHFTALIVSWNLMELFPQQTNMILASNDIGVVDIKGFNTHQYDIYFLRKVPISYGTLITIIGGVLITIIPRCMKYVFVIDIPEEKDMRQKQLRHATPDPCELMDPETPIARGLIIIAVLLIMTSTTAVVLGGTNGVLILKFISAVLTLDRGGITSLLGIWVSSLLLYNWPQYKVVDRYVKLYKSLYGDDSKCDASGRLCGPDNIKKGSIITNITKLINTTRILFKSLYYDGDSNQKKLFWFMLLTLTFMFVELFTGMRYNSLGLISDSFHMGLDTVSIGIGLYGRAVAKRGTLWLADPPILDRLPGPKGHYNINKINNFPFGYSRYLTLSGFVNGVTLVFMSICVFTEAVRRMLDPPHVDGGPIILVSCVGLLINVIGVVFFHDAHHVHGGCCSANNKDNNKNNNDCQSHTHSHGDDPNMRGVYLHILADLFGSIGVIISSVIVHFTKFHMADPVCSAILSCIILMSAIPLITSSARVLMQTTPPELIVVPCEGKGKGMSVIVRHSQSSPALVCHNNNNNNNNNEDSITTGLYSNGCDGYHERVWLYNFRIKVWEQSCVPRTVRVIGVVVTYRTSISPQNPINGSPHSTQCDNKNNINIKNNISNNNNNNNNDNGSEEGSIDLEHSRHNLKCVGSNISGSEIRRGVVQFLTTQGYVSNDDYLAVELSQEKSKV